MAITIPAAARGLLDEIAKHEAPKGYDTVYANRMSQMPKPLTSMTLAEVIADGPRRTKAFGSSACGRYQFMTATLKDLQKSLVLIGTDRFTPEFQDRLGYALLLRRGYAKFAAGLITTQAFGLALAQEWASFPVLAACQGAHRAVSRGQSYYAGDGVNKALVSPAAVEAALAVARSTAALVAYGGASPAGGTTVAAAVKPDPAAVAAPVVIVVPAPPVVPPADTRNVWQRVADRLRAAFPPQGKA